MALPRYGWDLLVMYVLTFTDDTTVESAKYTIDDGACKFRDDESKILPVPPEHSVRYVTKKRTSGDQGNCKN